MKQGCLKIAGVILSLFIFCFTSAADDVTKNIVSQVIDNFDNPEEIGWSWAAKGSKFIMEGYPKVMLVDHVPMAIKNVYPDPDGGYKVLGLEAKFSRQGDNWIDIFPVNPEGEITEIPFPGIVSQVDLWVWGSNYNYDLELLLRDSTGRVHTLGMGSLYFAGWKNLFVNIPTSIPQTQVQLPRYKGTTLVGLRIRTRPTERVDQFRIFFDQIKILTDMFETMYDGNELATMSFDDSGTETGGTGTTSEDSGL